MRIAIEGLDGSGKSTVARTLAQMLNYMYIEKPFNFMYDKMDLTEEQKKSIEWRLYETKDDTIISLYYGIGILYACRCIDQKDVIFDRHFASNFYWHGSEENFLFHRELIEWGGKPDLTIVLEATTENRIERLKRRNENDADLMNEDVYNDYMDKIISFLDKNNLNYVTVDTNEKNIDLVIEECIRIIKNLEVPI